MEDYPGLRSRELGFRPKTTSSTESSDASFYRRSSFGDSGGFEDLEKFFAGGAPNPPPPPNPDDDLLGFFKHSGRADGDLLGDLSGREGGGGKVAGGLPGLEELIIGFGTICSPRGRELRERGKETISQNTSCFLYQGLEESPKSDIPDSKPKENPGYFGPQQGQREKLEQEKEWKSSGRERQCELQREGDKVVAEKAIREVRERAIAEIQRRSQRAAAEAHQNSERLALKRANAEVRERAARLLAQRTRGAKGEKEYLKARERVAKTCVVVDTWETEPKDKAARDEATTNNQKVGQREAQRAAVDAQARCTRFSVERANARAQRRTVASEMQHWSETDLDSFFGTGFQTNSKTRQNAASAEFSFAAEFASGGMWASSSGSSTTNDGEKSSAKVDDLTSVFGDFEEINGEPKERQRTRLKRNQKALDRAAKALAEKIERDSILQREQVERDKIAEGLNVEIKSWAACKESNLRALLSTLQYVLWPGCGWQPVSLSDLITSDSVKKVYRKATLCVHPDKVQQKGATLEQKIIAEKVFDLLKEAWSKFNSEELF